MRKVTPSREFPISLLAFLFLLATWDRCSFAVCVFAIGRSLWPIWFSAKSEVYHTSGFKRRPLWRGVWCKVCALQWCVWMRTHILLLGYRSNVRWGLGNRTVCDLFHGSLEKVFYHWCEEVEGCQEWRHVSRTLSMLLVYGVSEMWKLHGKDLYPIFRTSSVWN